jgi:hypothetical protein
MKRSKRNNREPLSPRRHLEVFSKILAALRGDCGEEAHSFPYLRSSLCRSSLRSAWLRLEG